MVGQVPASQRETGSSRRFQHTIAFRSLRARDGNHSDYSKFAVISQVPPFLFAAAHTFPRQNATIWTGSADGLDVVKGDILLDRGLIKRVGLIEESLLSQYVSLTRINAEGRWVSPGFVATLLLPLLRLTFAQNHRLAQSHVRDWVTLSFILLIIPYRGVISIPYLRGGDEMNSFKGPVLPVCCSLPVPMLVC